MYLESTVFNYYFDVDRDGHEDTVRLFEAIGAGEYEGYTSEYVTGELEKTREPKRSNMLSLIEKYSIRILNDNAQVPQLARLYVENGIIPASYRLDSSHIAIASVYELDCVISYNFRHINRVKTKVLTAQLNRDEGYNSIVICTAKEVLDDGL